jgi:hypothetical protein
MRRMFARRTRIGAAKLLIGLFLFAQGMVAFAACDWGERSAARAVAAAPAGEAPCHEADQGMTVNVCVAHCLADSQSLDKPALKLPAVAPLAALVLPGKPAWLVRHWNAVPAPVSGPPPRILFKTLLI